MSDYIETDCTIEHEGRVFEAGGAYITPERITAYPAAGGILTDWHGKPLGTWRATSSWTHPTAFGCPNVYQIEARVNGITYTGRGFGEGMVYTGKRKARQ